MTLIKINPDALLPPPGNKHAHIVVAPHDARFAFIAGQVALDREGNIVGGRDVKAQAKQCFVCIQDCLKELKAGPHQIAEMTMIIVDYRNEMLEQINEAGDEVFGNQWPVTATTLIGAQALGHDAFLIEVKATVALTGEPWVPERMF